MDIYQKIVDKIYEIMESNNSMAEAKEKTKQIVEESIELTGYQVLRETLSRFNNVIIGSYTLYYNKVFNINISDSLVELENINMYKIRYQQTNQVTQVGMYALYHAQYISVGNGNMSKTKSASLGEMGWYDAHKKLLVYLFTDFVENLFWTQELDESKDDEDNIFEVLDGSDSEVFGLGEYVGPNTENDDNSVVEESEHGAITKNKKLKAVKEEKEETIASFVKKMNVNI